MAESTELPVRGTGAEDLLNTQDRTVVTSTAPQNKLTRADIEGPYRARAGAFEEMARGLDRLGEGLDQLETPLAERAGLQAVTRDAQGNLQVQPPPIIFGEAGRAYVRALKVGAAAEADGAADRADIELRTKYRDDPDGYLRAADAYKTQTVQQLTSAAGPAVGVAVGRSIDETTTRTYRGLLNEKERLDLQRVDNNITAGLQSASDNLSVLARGGVSQNDPAFKSEMDKYKTYLKEKVDNPRLAYTQAEADQELARFNSELGGQRFLHHIDQVYKSDPMKGAQLAEEAARDIQTDPSYHLPENMRDQLYHKAVGEVRAQEAIRHQNLGEARQAEYELSTASQLGAKIDPSEVESVAQAFRQAGDPGGAARIYGMWARKPLNDDFGRQPSEVQRQQLQDLNGAAFPQGSYLDNLSSAILGHEHGVTTSPQGARGFGQIMPATFEKYARPGESIDNPADNLAVHRRLLEDFQQRWPNDPARAAVAYFSGVDNVSPPGSPTPWIRNTHDVNESVESYVNNVMARMGRQGVYSRTSQSAGALGPNDVYSNIPRRDDRGENQIAKFVRWNPDPIGTSEARLAQVHPDLQAIVNRARQDNPDLKFIIGSGVRSAEDQRMALKWGWSTTDPDRGKDVNQRGIAVDLWGLDKNGKPQFDRAQQEQIAAAMKKAAGELGTPITWGGDWQTFKDRPHFQLDNPRPGYTPPPPLQVKMPTQVDSSTPAGASWLQENRQREMDKEMWAQWKEVMKDYDEKGIVPNAPIVNDIVAGAHATGNAALSAQVAHDMTRIDIASGRAQEPLERQQAEITQMTALGQGGHLSPGQAAVLGDMQKKYNSITTGLNENPIKTTATNFPDKVPTPAQLDFTRPPDANFLAGLKQHAQIADFAAKNWQTGYPLSALDKQEVEAARGALSTDDPNTKMQIYGAIAAALPQGIREATLAKIGGGEPKGMAEAAAGALAAEAPDVAGSIYQGMAAIKTDKRYDPADEGSKIQYQTDIDKALPSAIFPLQMRTLPSGPMATLSEMVRDRYAFLSASANDKTYSTSRLQQAVADVTGGIRYHNGGPLIPPVRGMTQTQFDQTINAVTDREMQGAVTQNGTPVTADYLKQNAQLETIGQGKYNIKLGRNDQAPVYAYNANGSKFVLDLTKVAPTGAVNPVITPGWQP